MSDCEFISTETLDDGRIVRILLDRPEARNAQNRGMLVELHDAFLAAEADDEVRVVIHSHWASLSDGKRWVATPEDGVQDWRTAPPVQPARKSAVGGA